jgi:hypothetical protein
MKIAEPLTALMAPRLFGQLQSNDSMHTLHTMVEEDASSTLLDSNPGPSYGATPPSQRPPSSGRVVFNAMLKMACLFIISTALLGGTLWLALPTLDE